jgi:hypothetical protein
MEYNYKIKHPGVALCVYIMIGATLQTYGITEGSALIFAFLAGILIYKGMVS